jgi:lipopolysaccharide export system protein LptA
MNRLNNFFLIVFFLAFSFISHAKTADENEAIHIEADSVEIREQEGISTYKGNVKITRGSLFIQGQLIKVISKNNSLQTFLVDGLPATFKQLNDQGEEISAKSQHLEYQSESGVLILDKDAVLVQGNNRFTSNHIIYNTLKDVIQAGNNGDTNNSDEPQRVTITIQPEKNKAEKNNP